MNTTASVLLAFGVFACGAICLKTIADYPFREERKTGVKLKFSELLDLYRVNPKKWTLEKSQIVYTMPTDSWYVRRVYCWLPLLDYIKYKRWLREKARAEEKRAAHQAFTDNYAALIKDVQEDINDSRTEHAEEVRETLETIWDSPRKEHGEKVPAIVKCEHCAWWTRGISDAVFDCRNPEGPRNAQSLSGCSKGKSIYEI